MILLYDDPLASYKLPLLPSFPLLSGSTELWTHHLHEVFLSFIFCHFIYSITDPLINYFQQLNESCHPSAKSLNVSDRRRKKFMSLGLPLSRLQTSNVRLQAVTFVMLSILCLSAIPLLNDPILDNKFNHPKNYTPYSGFCLAISLGYQFYLAAHISKDFFFMGKLFLIQKFFHITIGLILLLPYKLNYLSTFLLTDIANFFFYIRWFRLIFPNILYSPISCLFDICLFGSLLYGKIYVGISLTFQSIMEDANDFDWTSIIFDGSLIIINLIDIYWVVFLLSVLSYEHFPRICSFFWDSECYPAISSSKFFNNHNNYQNNNTPSIQINVFDSPNDSLPNSPAQNAQYFTSLEPNNVFTSSLYADENASDVDSYASSVE